MSALVCVYGSAHKLVFTMKHEITYSSFDRLNANASLDTLVKVETNLRDLNPKTLPENVETSTSGSSDPM